MELERLRYFLAVVGCGSVTAAARELRISQPALSQQIRALERLLGVALFERAASGMTPTAAGLALVAPCEAALRAYQTVHEVAAEVVGRTILRVAHTRSEGDDVVQHFLDAWQRRQPRVEILPSSGWTELNLARVRNAEVDAAAVRIPRRTGTSDTADQPGQAGLTFTVVGTDSIVAVFPADQAPVGLTSVSSTELARYPWVTWPREQGEQFHDALRAAFDPMGPSEVVLRPDGERIVAAVGDGLGVGLLDQQRARRLVTTDQVMLPLAEPVLIDIVLVTRSDDSRAVIRSLLKAASDSHTGRVAGSA